LLRKNSSGSASNTVSRIFTYITYNVGKTRIEVSLNQNKITRSIISLEYMYTNLIISSIAQNLVIV